MRIKFLFITSLLMTSSILLSSCQKTAATSAVDETAAATAATLTEAAPTPEPTEEPVIPCNIAFESDRDGNREVYTMSPDGSNQVNLTNNPADDFDPVWSPDGTRIAFVSNRENDSEGGQFIYTMLADGSDVTQVSNINGSEFPDWSPKGNQIAYNSDGDLFLIDLFENKEVRLTDTPEKDEQPKFSPDGMQIAWLKGDGEDHQIFVMDVNSGSITQVTTGGRVNGVEWTIDGRIFTVWEHPEGICMNCVVSADGSEVIDAGGKGTVQEFLPFWTDEGDRVEMGSGDINGSGREDIFLVGEIYPDIFKFLTNDAGNNRSPDAAAMCGPYRGAIPASAEGEEVDEAPSGDDTAQGSSETTIGYTGSIGPMIQAGFDQACAELDIECIHGENISELVDKGVDAIVNASNRWDINGSSPQLHDAVGKGIPVFVLNADSTEPGAYNLSTEYENYTTTLTWMFKSMIDEGDFVYYNYGDNGYIQSIIDSMLKDYPGIRATAKEATYDVNPFAGQEIQNLIASNPNLEAIWSSEPSNDLFWAMVDKANSHIPFMECPAREDILTAWKNEMDAGTGLQCISYVRPGGTAYEGIYVAYYFLSGLEFNPEMLTGEANNTLKYVIPVITNDNLDEWLGKLGDFITGEDGQLKLPQMDPEQIKETWFLQ